MLVTAEQALIAEAVRAALVDRGHDVYVLRWPGDVAVPGPRGTRGRPPLEDLDAGLLLSDLDRWSRVRAAALVIESIDLPWVVMAGRPPDAAWGAVLEAGARLVVPSRVSLDEVAGMLGAVVREGLTAPPQQRARLEESWRELRSRHETSAERLASLSPREREVLRLLYSGTSVAGIAEVLEVSPETVRSQVKSVLRKLGTASQLSAVAMFREAQDDLQAEPLG